MRIKNRLFPYPVLNNNSRISDYNEKTVFELSFDKDNIQSNDDLVLKNVCLKINDEHLISLMKQGKVKGVLIVECSNTVFRKKYDISLEKIDIKIPADRFNGNVELSAFVYAADDIDKYMNINFIGDYGQYYFKIEKYCILAADDGYIINVSNNPKTEEKKSSIFTIVCDLTTNSDLVRYSMNPGVRKITIFLSQDYYRQYNLIKQKEEFLNASFATIAIPVLSECLMEVRGSMADDETISDLCLKYPWFSSVCGAYEREKGVKLDENLLKETRPMELAQIVFNNTSCKSISDIYSVVICNNNESDKEE